MKSEVFNEDCMIGMKRYPDKYFDLLVIKFVQFIYSMYIS